MFCLLGENECQFISSCGLLSLNSSVKLSAVAFPSRQDVLEVWHVLPELGSVCQSKPKNGIKLESCFKKEILYMLSGKSKRQQKCGQWYLLPAVLCCFFSSHFLWYPRGCSVPSWMSRARCLIPGACLVPQPKTSWKYNSLGWEG